MEQVMETKTFRLTKEPNPSCTEEKHQMDRNTAEPSEQDALINSFAPPLSPDSSLVQDFIVRALLESGSRTRQTPISNMETHCGFILTRDGPRDPGDVVSGSKLLNAGWRGFQLTT